VHLGRLNRGEWLAGTSAVLLFASMFLHWFGVKLINTSNLLFAIVAVGGRKNAWGALDYIPTLLVIAILGTLALMALCLADAFLKPRVRSNAVVAILGLASMVLILFRMINPPTFFVEATITSEGAIRWPMFLALLAATGMACGGCLALWEEGGSPRGVRIRQRQEQDLPDRQGQVRRPSEPPGRTG
jgi:uncharacterized membrane protein